MKTRCKKKRRSRPTANAQKRKRRPNPLRVDPTRTAGLRRAFIAELNRRFSGFKAALIKLVVDEDAFGLLEATHDPFTANVSLTTNAGQWRFHTSPQKLKAFQDWIRRQIGLRIVKGEEDKLWQMYIEQGWKKGMGRAFDDARGVPPPTPSPGAPDLGWYAGTREEFLRSSFNRPVSVEKVKLLAERSYTDLKNVTEDMATRLGRTLVDGLIRGDGPRQVARQLVDQIDVSQQRATVIARTEIIRAHAEGQLTALEEMGVEEVGVAVEWSTTGDERVCELCAPLEGVVLKVSEARGMLPRHPQCVLPGNYAQGRVIAALKSFYSGDAVEVITSNGTTLTLTVNHGVFSKHGLVRAGEIKVGDDLLSYDERLEQIYNPDIEHRPALIEDIYESFNTMIDSKVVGGFDFDGDEKSMVGKVDVVFSNLPLSKGVTNRFQSRDEVGLVPSGYGSMGGASLHDLLLRSHSGPLDGFGLALIPGGYTERYQSGPYESPRYAEAQGDGVFGFTRDVGVAHGDVVKFGPSPQIHSFGFASELDTVFSQPTGDGISFNPDFTTQTLERFPAKVSFDKVVNVRRFHYSGPVYDLETVHGYFTINQGGPGSVIIRNCRCAFRPANVGEPTKGQKRTKDAVQAALSESGLSTVVSDARPESILNHYGVLDRFMANVFCATGTGGGVDPTCSPGSGSAGVGAGEVVSLKGSTLYRASNSDDKTVREAGGGHQAIGAGTYFAEDKKSVAGYGSNTHSYKVGGSGKFLHVKGDKDMDVIRREAKDWAESGVKKHMEDVMSGRAKMDATRVAAAYTPAEQIRSYLESKGFAGVRYQNVSSDDHHDQVLVFRTDSVTANAFCATGPGGGVDPTCSPGEGSGAGTVSKQDLVDYFEAGPGSEYQEASARGGGLKAGHLNSHGGVMSGDEATRVNSTVARIQSAAESNRPQVGLMFRGMSVESPESVTATFKVGGVWTAPQLTSFSPNKSIASMYEGLEGAGLHPVVVKVKNTTHRVRGLRLKDSSIGADEVIVPKGERFRVEKVTTEGGRTVVVLSSDNPLTSNFDYGTTNAFCATGPGGGIDPTCGKGGAAKLPPEPEFVSKNKADNVWQPIEDQ